jgi:hypothetical protein
MTTGLAGSPCRCLVGVLEGIDPSIAVSRGRPARFPAGVRASNAVCA